MYTLYINVYTFISVHLVDHMKRTSSQTAVWSEIKWL